MASWLRCALAAGIVLLALGQPADAFVGDTLVLTPGEPLTAEAVDRLLLSAAPIEPAGQRLGLRVTHPQLPLSNASTRAVEIRLVDLSFDAADRFMAQLQVAVEGGPVNPLGLSGRISREVEVPVLESDIQAGDLVQASDLGSQWMPVSRIASDAVQDSLAIVGQQATRRLTAGRTVRAGDLRTPAAIERGEAVAMVFQMPGLEILGRGRALEDGAEGDVVRVMNIDSERTVRGTVVAPGRVVIKPGHDRS